MRAEIERSSSAVAETTSLFAAGVCASMACSMIFNCAMSCSRDLSFLSVSMTCRISCREACGAVFSDAARAPVVNGQMSSVISRTRTDHPIRRWNIRHYLHVLETGGPGTRQRPVVNRPSPESARRSDQWARRRAAHDQRPR
jgi:hypothetical protein